MKNFIILTLLICTMSIQAQEKLSTQEIERKNEITINALTLIASKWIDLSYDYIIDDESSLGIDMQVSLDNNDDQRLDGFRSFSITPNYRRFFSDSYAQGFYAEVFGMLHTYEELDLNSTDFSTTKETNFSLGVSLGGKWVTKKGFIVDLFLGIGRNLIDSENDLIDVAGRVGISVGYRF